MAITESPVRARPKIDEEVLFAIHPELLNDAYIYVHVHMPIADQELLVRIWKSTYLIDKRSGNKSALIHAENITYAPVWTIVPQNFSYTFLLIFYSLPKSCTAFDLVEQIPQPGGFYIPDIGRNKSDVYHIWLAV